ncbi:hypothetical protein ACEN4B_08840 [Marinilactibacillus psychrotolerans]|uniref:hypothetical protein n=1 Tax=Marinilactibacillus psychrotolerans TaxID=191770 RepID=UPI0038844372
MESEELQKDWFIRYNYILGTRQTDKQKGKFIDSILFDLEKLGKKAYVHPFGQNNYGKNIYVGNVKKAKKIICTYYDTPISQHKSYHLNKYELNKKNTVKSIAIQSIIFLGIGLLFTLFVGIPIYQVYNFVSLPSILTTFFYAFYFIILKKISTGWPEKNNSVRNTSSLLLLLQFMNQYHTKGTAFALLDSGTYNQAGLDELIQDCQGEIYLLDSVGADQPMYQISENKQLFVLDSPVIQVEKKITDFKNVLTLTSMGKNDQSFQLERDSLKQKEINETNMNMAFEFLEKIIRR